MALLKRVVQDDRAALQTHTERGLNKCDLPGTETAQGGIERSAEGAITTSWGM